jgi:hypothetical protein
MIKRAFVLCVNSASTALFDILQSTKLPVKLQDAVGHQVADYRNFVRIAN